MKFINILFLIIFSSCATLYQPDSFSGGFSEVKYSEDVVKIVFNGNGYTGSGTVQDYCFLRAADYSYQHGYKFFSILSNNNHVTLETVQSSPGQIKYDAFRNTATYTDPSYMTFNKSSSVILIKMSNEESPGSFNSLEIKNNLSKSLGVDTEQAKRSISNEQKDMKKSKFYQMFFVDEKN